MLKFIYIISSMKTKAFRMLSTFILLQKKIDIYRNFILSNRIQSFLYSFLNIILHLFCKQIEITLKYYLKKCNISKSITVMYISLFHKASRPDWSMRQHIYNIYNYIGHMTSIVNYCIQNKHTQIQISLETDYTF
jgi:hypothetical protein